MNSTLNQLSQNRITAWLAALNINLETSAVFLGATGSLAEGLGTPKSDIDLLLVTRDPEILGVKSGEFFVANFSNTRGEILVITPEDFRRSISLFNHEKLPTREQLDYMYRLNCGVPLLVTEEFSRWKEDFQLSQFKIKAMERALVDAVNEYDDLMGAKENSDSISAIPLTRRLLHRCLDQLLIKEGDLYLRDKWRMARARRSLPHYPYILKEFIGREFAAPVASETEQWGWVEDTLLFCRHIQFNALFDVSDKETEGLVESGSDCTIVPNPWLILTKLDNKFFVKLNASMYQICDFSAAIIGRLDRAKSANNLMRELFSTTYYDTKSLAPLNQPFFLRILSSLEEIGVIKIETQY